MKQKKIYIQGMHCVSCEQLLHNEFKEVSGVREAVVSQKDNTAVLSYEGTLDMEQIKAVAKKYGYAVFEQAPTKSAPNSTFFSWLMSLLIVFLFLAAFNSFQRLGIMDSLQLESANVSTGMAFLIGVAASLSSCLVVVGAVVMAFGERFGGQGTTSFHRVVKPNILFHLSRIATFYLLGGLLGVIGGQLLISGQVISIITIAVAILMLLLGLSTIGWLPSLSSLGVRLPRSIAGKRWTGLKKSDHPLAPLAIGALSFFLPCGFTQSMQIMALASGSFQQGSLILLAFALGTTPILFLLGTSASWIRQRKSIVLKRAIGLMIILFSVYTFYSGWALSGVKTNVLGNNTADTPATNEQKKNPSTPMSSTDKQQVINMSITSRGFEPRRFEIKKGVPVKWVINGQQVTGCTNQIIVPSLNITQDINKGLNVIEFTPQQEGKIAFSCWMGMVRGEFVVI